MGADRYLYRVWIAEEKPPMNDQSAVGSKGATLVNIGICNFF